MKKIKKGTWEKEGWRKEDSNVIDRFKDGAAAIEFKVINNFVYDKKEDQVITYTPTGKTKQSYTVRGNQIFNKNGKEVFIKDSKDRNKIFANLAVQEGRAVVVSLKGDNYVINNKNQIMSVKTGNIMKWEENNEIRQEILTLAAEKFASKNNFASPITSKLWETNKEKLQEAYPTLTEEEFSRENESVQQKIINCI